MKYSEIPDFKMKTKLIQQTLFKYLIYGLLCIQAGANICPCANKKDCDHPIKDLGVKKEVFVFSNGTTDMKEWSWDSFTTLIVPSSFSIAKEQEAKTMCVAHSKGRKFGITVEMSLSGQINDTSEEAQQWVKSVISQQRDWHADIITVNLLPYFLSDTTSSKQDHNALVKILSNMTKEINEVTAIVKVACIVPWIPPCAEDETSCDFTEHSNEACDFYVISPDSFTDVDNVKCRARANIPLSKLLYGISEYNSHHISNNRIILGVSWHGYDYTCESFTDKICSLNVTNKNSTKCNFSQRKKITIDDIIMKNVTEFYDHKFDALYNAPYYNYYNKTDKHQHQVWFEDQNSLITKYRLVTELQLGGLALLHGDDLKSTITENFMWSWVAHEVLIMASQKTDSDSFYYADTISGVAVGCLLLGTALGIVFTCFGLRSQVKKHRQPFVRDMANGVNDYTDDDPNL